MIGPSKVSHGSRRNLWALVLPGEALASNGFWERGSHCFPLCSHLAAHQAPIARPKPRVTQMIQVKFSGSQKKKKRHEFLRIIGRREVNGVEGTLE